MNENQERIKRRIQQRKTRIGVFQIRNTVNGKIYIEASINLDKIWNRHRVELNFGGHRNASLQKEWSEFGETNFKYEILSEIKQAENTAIDYSKEAKHLAKMFIEELQPFGDKGYN